MAKPFLTLTTEHWLTGVGPYAHAQKGGIFYKAYGVTALIVPGGTESSQNGLLRGGPIPTDLTSTVVVDAPVGKARLYTAGGNAYLYMLGAGGHFYQLNGLTSAITDLRPTGGSPGPISSPANGVGVFQPIGGTQYTYYTQETQIGRGKLLDSSPAFTDNWLTGLDSTTQHPIHRYFDALYFGNNNKVGSITDDGSGDSAGNLNVLDVPTDSIITALSDDGIYLAIGITNNIQSTAAFSDTKVLFWDGSSDSWLREYPIDDPLILSLTRVGNVVIAQGINGLYQVSFSGGVKKLLARATGPFTTGSNRQLGPAVSGTYNQLGYVFGARDLVHTFGALDPSVPAALMTPIEATTNDLYDISLVETQLTAGVIYVATTQPKLLKYVFSNGVAGQTGVSAQTVYIQLQEKVQVNRIDVILGAPLASGDALNIELQASATDSAVQFGQDIAYNSTKTQRRISLYSAKGFVADEQISVIINFTGGTPLIKTLEFYGDAMEP